jgi:prepilin-type N-terminal cleavage/methylation domain-containing protein
MNRRAFTLVELLVTLTLILLLMGLVLGAVRAAQTTQKSAATRLLIDKINTIVMQQFDSYGSKNVDETVLSSLSSSIADRSHARAWHIRRNMISADLPDRWTDVQFMATPANNWTPQSASQRTYIAIWNAAVAANRTPTSQYAGAECLFMIVMRGGLADCLDCGDLRTAQIGDQDTDSNGNIIGDGMPEFLDAWGNPIGFILWPAAVELPPGTGVFTGALDQPFAGTPPPRPSLGMRPLIYSAGPDGEYSFDRASETGNLSAGTGPLGRDCGNWQQGPTLNSAGLAAPDYRADNITNFDAEAKK